MARHVQHVGMWEYKGYLSSSTHYSFLIYHSPLSLTHLSQCPPDSPLSLTSLTHLSRELWSPLPSPCFVRTEVRRHGFSPCSPLPFHFPFPPQIPLPYLRLLFCDFLVWICPFVMDFVLFEVMDANLVLLRASHVQIYHVCVLLLCSICAFSRCSMFCHYFFASIDGLMAFVMLIGHHVVLPFFNLLKFRRRQLNLSIFLCR